MSSAVIRIAEGYLSGADVLSLADSIPSGITSSGFDQSTGTLTLTGLAGTAAYVSAIEAVRFRTSVSLVQSQRTLELELFDANAAGRVDGPLSGCLTRRLRVDAPLVTQRVSVADGDGGEADASSFGPVVSDEGRYVLFASTSNALVSGDSNGSSDVDLFVRDRQTGATTLATRAADGGQIADPFLSRWDLSGDGRFVVFSSISTATRISVGYRPPGRSS